MTEFIPIDQRVLTLRNLTQDLPQDEVNTLLTRHHLMERGGSPSPYLPSLGMEIETFAMQHRRGVLPYARIDEVESAGIKRDAGDSYPVRGKLNKWEIALEPVWGSEVLLVREIQQLIERGLIIPKDKHHGKRKSGKNTPHTLDRYQPVHVTVGGIKRDFPPRLARKDAIRLEGERIYENELRTHLTDWVEFQDQNDGWKRKYMQSDCFVLARLLDASLYATSPERLESSYIDWIDGNEIHGHSTKGISGVLARDEDPLRGFNGIELRTSEMWGTSSLDTMARYLASVQAIGAALIAFQKIPMETRDEILTLEYAGNTDGAFKLVAEYNGYDLEHDKELAILWLDTRRQVIQLFASHGITDPGTEYWRTEFLQFADVLRKEQLKMDAGQPNLISAVRKLIIAKRTVIKQLIFSPRDNDDTPAKSTD